MTFFIFIFCLAVFILFLYILDLWKMATDEHVYASDWGRFD